MKNHLVYITTDANRVYLEAGYCQDITLQLFELQTIESNFLSTSPKFTRIVYVESFDNIETANKRKNELNMYTRMQKERIIRRNNPNWIGLTTYNIKESKKAAVYA